MSLPPYLVFPELSNERVLLRAVTDKDIKQLLDISFYDAKPAESIHEALKMQVRINQDYMEGNSIHWCIEERSTKHIVGTCGYYRGFENKTGELGCVLLPAFYGKGFMSEAMALTIGFGFHTAGLETITAITSVSNAKAVRLLERLNFKQTEILIDDELKFELNRPPGF